jgi:hypothetical protein
MMITTTTGVEIMGFDFHVTVDIEITHWGCQAKLSGPPENCWPAEAPEWFIHSITLQTDEARGLGPEWDINPACAMFDVLCDLPAIEYACDEAVSEAANERYFESRRYRRRSF